MTYSKDIFEKRGNSSNLVVIFHGYRSSPEAFSSIQETIQDKMENYDIFIPSIPLKLLSIKSPNNIAHELLIKVDRLYAGSIEKKESKNYENIIFIGHSAGAIIARKLYIYACGEMSGVHFQQDISAKNPRIWAKKVNKIILLSGLNKGWTISHHIPPHLIIKYKSLEFIFKIIQFFRRRTLTPFYFQKGSQFITQLRLQWVNMLNKIGERDGLGKATVIQLLGSIDKLVSPEDDVDPISGDTFIYLDMPYSGHINVKEMNDSTEISSSENTKIITIGEVRKSVFTKALIDSKETLQKLSIQPFDSPLNQRNEEVEHVIFVIHGMRDLGYWTHKIARRAIQLAKKNNPNIKIKTETSSYGYFPILSFLTPHKRRKKMDWLMEKYIKSLALYPKAKFSFLGHSTGTLLLAKALQMYPSCKFKYVAFAGSIVQTNYKWSNVATGKNKQVEKVINYQASGDYVVAIIPRAVETLNWQNFGFAGHQGFITSNNIINNSKYIKGGHSAALVEKNWDAIAHFLLNGKTDKTPKDIQTKSPNRIINFFSKISPLLVLIGIVLIFTLIACPFLSFSKIGHFPFVSVSLYLENIWKSLFISTFIFSIIYYLSIKI